MSLINLEDLILKKPYLKLYLNSIQNGNENYKLSQAKGKEEYYLTFQNKNLTSAVAPLTASLRMIGESPIKETELVVVLGLGNPHLITELNNKLQQNQIIIFIDSSEDVLNPLWEKFLYPTLSIPGRHIFLGDKLLHLLWSYIESLPIERLSGIKVFKNQPSVQLDVNFYEEIHQKINQLFSSKMSDLLTKFEFERIWVRNSIINLIQFNRNEIPCYRFKDYLGTLENIPAMLVSAGPSLRSQCPFIKKNRDKVFLIACDTALKVLLKFNIIPDAVMTLDAQTHSYFHFLGEDLTEIPIFADFVTSPRLLRSLSFKSIVHSLTAKFQVDAYGKPFREVTAGGEIVEEKLGSIGEVQSGGSVATSAFDIIRQMGCSPIFLVGQDLAYTGREIHSTGTHHNEKWLTIINRKKSLEKINEEIVRKRETTFVKAANGGQVLTDYVLGLYKHWFEESANSTNLPIYNINENGSYIENLKNISVATAEDVFLNISEHKYPWKNLNPWKKDNSEKMENKIQKEEFLNDLNHLKQFIDCSHHLESQQFTEELLDKVKMIPYLKQMIRKTEIYVKRHELELTENRKKDILVSSILKEIRFLKKGILIA
ncbi:MAG TPA: DUF115 domain-containing protein [Leptospiraceae bacterium]|nr:DUF115 domain-containing protein [Leptospiraceae bacterium]HMW07280.1 DUF115 domain-containing protein [Leptospiraceae bacterium]HMX33719.1 DUF115 domain-containing protein [Leptospiraceae bacterium]HMY32902.1 DUF115 domain-containing protein [Leptospiraceae bacterium]HNA09014.1 DUF115 domain-containing protein [Leptospiraceae bacterium]